MAWALWTCPVDCSLPSSRLTSVVSYPEISGPGVVAGFVVAAGVTVLAVSAAYLHGSDSHDKIHHAPGNVIDETVLESTRKMGRLTASCAQRLIPSGIASWLARILGHHRIRRVFLSALIGLGDIQIFAGLAILIRGFTSLCPSPTQPNGVPAYHWQILVNLAWFSTITYMGPLSLMQKYFQEHRWQRNVRLSLMCTQLVLLFVALLPTTYFNWYSERAFAQLTGSPGYRGYIPFEWRIAYPMLEKSAAQPVSPALCYFNVSGVNDLYRSADPCRWGDLTPVDPPELSLTATSILRNVIWYENADLREFGDIRELYRVPKYFLDQFPRLEQYCDLHTPLYETDSFQAAVNSAASLVILFALTARRLFGFPPETFKRHIRSPISLSSRRVIDKTSRMAMQRFPTTGHKPDLAEGIVTTPLLALHLTVRLMLDMLTSKLAKVLLLIFAFAQGCIALYPAHDSHFHRIQSDGWTSGQILAVLFPLSPLALVLLRIFSCAWRRSSNQPEDQTFIFPISNPDHVAHDKNLENINTELEKSQIRNANNQEESCTGNDGATAILNSLEYRSSKWMSIAVWLLVISVTLLASTHLIYTYVDFPLFSTLSTLLPIALVALPVACYAWALTGLHIRSEAAHRASGYRHGSRFIKWTTKPSVAQFMKFTAALCPLGIVILAVFDVLGSQGPLPRAIPGRHWVLYLFDGSFWAIVEYFSESIYINLVMWYFNHRAPEGTSGLNVGR